MTPEEFIRSYYEYDETEFEPQTPWMKFSFSDLVQLLNVYGNSIEPENERIKSLLLDVYHDYQWEKIVDEMSDSTVTEQKMELRNRIEAFEKLNNL